MLTPAQASALDHVRRHARERGAAARATIGDILAMSNIAPGRFDEVAALVRAHARIALHFHPDRPDASGRPVAAALRDDGRYRSQFETRLSAGSVTAHPGGSRDRWEAELFGSAYHEPRAPDRERPKYGALDLVGHADGPSPRFGSCYLVLDPAVSARSTFTYRDSHLSPRERGTLDELDDLLGAALSDAFSYETTLGLEGARPPAVVSRLEEHLPAPFARRFERAPARNLDHYIEAQIHGDVELARDVDHLVADPAFRGSATGDLLEQVCAQHDLTLHWHGGSELAVEQVPSDFRGPAMPGLARRVALGGLVDARLIGEAAADLARRPEAWADRGSYAVVLQELKLLWHVLCRHGRLRRVS